MTFPLLETFLFSLFDTLQYYLITNKMSNGRLKVQLQHIPFIVLCASIAAACSYLIEGAYSYIGGTAALLIFSWHIFKKSGFALAFLHVLSVSVVLVVQFIVIFIVYLVMGSVEYSPSVGIVAQSLGLAIAFSVAFFLPLHVLYRFVETKNDLFRVISLNLFIVLSFCVIYWYMHYEGIFENLVLLSAIVVSVLLINVIFLREGLKNHGIEEQNRAYKLYLPIVNELVDEIRIRQHDFDNHIAALKAVLESKKETQAAMDKVEEHINEIDKSFGNFHLLKMKNRIIAGFLYTKMKQSKDEKIKFEIIIDDYSTETALKDYELLDILSILVDNAFETNIPGNHVMLRFYKEKGRSVIEVANKHPYIPISSLEDFFTKGYSEKSADKRGIGLYKLRQIVTENCGDIEVQNADLGENYIVFKVSLA